MKKIAAVFLVSFVVILGMEESFLRYIAVYNIGMFAYTASDALIALMMLISGVMTVLSIRQEPRNLTFIIIKSVCVLPILWYLYNLASIPRIPGTVAVEVLRTELRDLWPMMYIFGLLGPIFLLMRQEGQEKEFSGKQKRMIKSLYRDRKVKEKLEDMVTKEREKVKNLVKAIGQKKETPSDIPDEKAEENAEDIRETEENPPETQTTENLFLPEVPDKVEKGAKNIHTTEEKPSATEEQTRGTDEDLEQKIQQARKEIKEVRETANLETKNLLDKLEEHKRSQRRMVYLEILEEYDDAVEFVLCLNEEQPEDVVAAVAAYEDGDYMKDVVRKIGAGELESDPILVYRGYNIHLEILPSYEINISQEEKEDLNFVGEEIPFYQVG